jgi:hypothetical protein
MSGSTVTSPSRRRAVALSSAIAMFALSGLTSMAAYASEAITVTATVEECVISITDVDPLDLGDMPTVSNGFYEFESIAALDVEWSAGMNSCVGSLYVERADIVKNGDGGHVATAEIYLDLGDGDVTVTTDAVDTGASVSPTSFDVTMEIPVTAGAGTYSTTLTFTVVVDG